LSADYADYTDYTDEKAGEIIWHLRFDIYHLALKRRGCRSLLIGGITTEDTEKDRREESCPQITQITQIKKAGVRKQKRLFVIGHLIFIICELKGQGVAQSLPEKARKVVAG